MANIKEAKLLLPWYITNSLNKEDKRYVDEALKEFPSLQQEMTEQFELFNLIKEDTAVLDISVITTIDQRLDNLFDRIDEEEKTIVSTNKETLFETNVNNSIFSSIINWFIALLSAPKFQYALAVIAVLVVIQVIVLSSFELAKPVDGYKLADTDEVVLIGDESALTYDAESLKSVILIVFKKEMTPSEIDRILKQYNAKVISHPNGSMNYLVQLSTPLKASEFNTLLQKIKDIPSISFAAEGEVDSASY